MRRRSISSIASHAHEAIEEAEVLWAAAHYNAYVSRLYYACFYAASAMLLTHHLSASTHTGVRHLFSQEFIKPGIIDRDIADIYFELFHYRQRTDYEDEFRVDPVIAKPWLVRAHTFNDTVEQIRVTKQHG